MASLTLILICTCSILVRSSDDLPRANIITWASSCRPYRVFVGQQYVRFTCEATSSNGDRATSYLWTFRGAPISYATGRVLNLSPITKNSGGSYTCIGRYVSGTSSPVTLDVQYGPSVQAIRSISVTEFQNLNVVCSVDSNPLATVKWTSKTNAQFTPRTGSTLTISNIQRSQAGTYVCTATNTLSPCGGTSVVRSDSVEVTVDVHYKPYIRILSLNHATNRVTVSEGDRLTLRCEVDSNPLSTIKLLFGRKELTTAFKSLTVDYTWSADCRHTGTFSCEAANSVRDPTRGFLQLFVRCSPRPDDMFPLPRKYVSSPGANVILSMTILSYPLPTIVWKRPEGNYQNNLSSLSGETNTSALTLRSTLRLKNLQEEDFGLYQVHANNAVGKIVESLTLVSQGPPVAPSDVTVQVTDSSSLNIGWKQEFNGGSVQIFTVEYSKDKSYWDEAGSYEETGSGKYHHAVLSHLDSDTTYYVRIISRNIYGDSKYTVAVEGRTESQLKDYTTLSPRVTSNEGDKKTSLVTEQDPVVIAGLFIGVIFLIASAVILVLSRKCCEEARKKGLSEPGTVQNTQGIYSDLHDTKCDKQIYTQLKSLEKLPTECNSDYQGLQMRSTPLYEDLKISNIKTSTELNAGDQHIYEN